MLTDPQVIKTPFSPLEQTGVADRPPLRPVKFELLGMSFGAAEDYTRRGGLRVIADDSTTAVCQDIAAAGLDFPRDLGRGVRATGAFAIGSSVIRIRIRLAIDFDGSCRGFVRARAGQQARVPETTIDFTDGQAEVDLPLIGISTHTVQTVDELWTWECRLEGSDFEPISIHYAGSMIDAFPIRLYFTAGRPINALPRESFYHVACAASGATNPMQAQRAMSGAFHSVSYGAICH